MSVFTGPRSQDCHGGLRGRLPPVPGLDKRRSRADTPPREGGITSRMPAGSGTQHRPQGRDGMALAYCDISTGELAATEEQETTKTITDMTDVLVRLGVKEVILSRSFEEKYGASRVKDAVNAYTDIKDDDYSPAWRQKIY